MYTYYFVHTPQVQLDSATQNPARYTTLSRRQQGASNNNPNDQTTESQPDEGDFEDLVGSSSSSSSPADDLLIGNGGTGQEGHGSGDATLADNADFSPLSREDEFSAFARPESGFAPVPF